MFKANWMKATAAGEANANTLHKREVREWHERHTTFYRKWTESLNRFRLCDWLFLAAVHVGTCSWCVALCISVGAEPVWLTEHHLQPHQTAHEVVEVDGHVGVGVSSHQQLVDGVVEAETCRRTTPSSPSSSSPSSSLSSSPSFSKEWNYWTITSVLLKLQLKIKEEKCDHSHETTDQCENKSWQKRRTANA